MREELIRSGLPPERVILPALDETFTLAVAETIREAPGVARIAPAELERDWYNDYAALILELGHRLEEITEASERRVLLARLRDALEETEPS
jgi:hypothetical protein